MNEKQVNAADEKQVRNGQRQDNHDRQKQLNDLRVILGTEEGRRFFWRLLDFCGINRVEYSGNVNDMVFHCGMRNVGGWVLSEILEAAPRRYGEIIINNLDAMKT